MTTQLHDTGEEYIMDKLDGESFDIGLYNDSTDNLADSDDIGDITTEPSSGNYSRQTSEPFSSKDLSGDWGLQADNTVTFDVTNSTQTVDAGFVIVNFTSDDTGDTSATDHLLFTFSLSQSRDLSELDTLNVDNIEGTLS